MRKDPYVVPRNPMPCIATNEIPGYIKINLAEALFREIQKDFQRPDMKADYERWQAKQKAKEGKEWKKNL